MSSFRHLLAILVLAFGLLTLAVRVDAACSVCMTSGVACVGETTFRLCKNGEPEESNFECPDGTVCTSDEGICQPRYTGFPECLPLCQKCVGHFACVSKTQFAYCDADGVQGVIGPCLEGEFCSTGLFQATGTICGPLSLIQPTCSNTELPKPPSAAGDWKDTCKSTTTPGYYKNIYDPTCKSYVYCRAQSSDVEPWLYHCSTQYFDEVTRNCVTTKPSNCT